jgi:hypothetical protein
VRDMSGSKTMELHNEEPAPAALPGNDMRFRQEATVKMVEQATVQRSPVVVATNIEGAHACRRATRRREMLTLLWLLAARRRLRWMPLCVAPGRNGRVQRTFPE